MTNSTQSPSADLHPSDQLGGEESLASSPRAWARVRSRHLPPGVGLVAAYVVLLIVIAVLDSRFFEGENLKTMIIQNAGLALTVAGVAIVIVGGSYDLSVGGIAGISGVLAAKLAMGHAVVLADVAGVAAGVGCGVINGIIVARLRVNSFMATFATGLAFVGLALKLQGAQEIFVVKNSFGDLGLNSIGPIPVPILLVVVGFIVAGLLLQATKFGQGVYAVGDNAEAARLLGVPAIRTSGMTFAISGFAAGLGGVVTASQLGLGAYTSGQNLPIEAIAAVVVGGISVYGGEGKMWRAAIGLLILASLNTMFSQLAWSTQTQDIAEGLVVLLALAANIFSRHGTPASGSPVEAELVETLT